ncbi:26S proteasome non-ATPase regulatory subunit 9 isoform X2 [Echeneis naucrates]|uniref:26S proteasome non-ATPase regulatory subunit 9 isoform X2 n=1 Tax=Echeneis naucrates TaxID=173247 RepID=UPI00111391C3|nr:26S proteasome non-ATPase regulatory subunit 9 isoform X2 [Echeneis naucrates]
MKMTEGNCSEVTMDDVKNLIKKKDDIEEQIKAYYDVLEDGLRVGDEVTEFGSVNTANFQNLQNIAAVVQHSEGKPLWVTVIREGQKVQMSLTPQRWSGRGLLGCNIVPIQR